MALMHGELNCFFFSLEETVLILSESFVGIWGFYFVKTSSLVNHCSETVALYSFVCFYPKW